MTYEVNFTDPSKLPIVIPPRTVNTSATDVALYGYTTLEYGEPLNETFLHLLENFATPATGLGPAEFNVPTSDALLNQFLRSPIEGQYWFNKTRNALYVFHSGVWHEIALGSHISANWGVVTHGQSIPRPVNRFGYVFPYEECSWSIAPREFTSKPDWFVCMTDSNGVVNSRVRYEGSPDLMPLQANYLILGIRHNTNSGTVRDNPCPPSSVSILRRLPTALSGTTSTTGTVSVDLEAVPGVGTLGPVTYSWELTGVGTDWVFTSNTPLDGKRIVGQLTKADVTTAGSQTCVITVTMVDACSQISTAVLTLDFNFELAELPTPTVSNCNRTISVEVPVGNTVTRSNKLSVNRPTNATWVVEWDVDGITNTCSDVTHTVTQNTSSALGLSFDIEGTVDETCTYTIPYRIRDTVTNQLSPQYTCTTTIVRDVVSAPPGNLEVEYACTVGAQIGNAGGPAVGVSTLPATASGGTAPYSFSLDPGAPGAGFDDSDCIGAGVTIDSVSISSSTGVVSFQATPPPSGTGECTIDMVTVATDAALDTGVASHTKKLRWGTAASNYVNGISATCPAAVSINSSSADPSARSATITIPVTVFNQSAAVMTSGAEIELTLSNGCGSDVEIVTVPGVITVSSATTNVSFTVRVPQNSDFTCSSLVARLTARNTSTSWSTCEATTTCNITVTAESSVAVPLTMKYRSNLSTSVASCEACDTTACGPTATIVVDVSGGTGPYELLPQPSSASAGNGWSLTGTSCADNSHIVNVSINASGRITATIKMVDGKTARNCDGNIVLKVRDAVGTQQTITRGFSLVRTVCPPPCFEVVPFTAGGAHFCLGFMSSTTTPSTSCAGNGATSTTPTVFSPGTTSGAQPTTMGCASLNATSHSATISAANRLVVDGQTVWWPRPAAKLSIKIVVPGVGETPLVAVIYRPSNYANANGTTTQVFPVVVGSRTFNVTFSLTVSYLGVTQFDGNCNNQYRYSASASYSISPSMGSCSTYTDPVTTTTAVPPGGPGDGPCFTKDMIVLKSDGSKVKVGSIVPGDQLRGYAVPGMTDESRPNWREWTTTAIDEGGFQNVTVRSARTLLSDHYYYINESIKVTGDHPLLVRREGVWGWKSVKDIVVGDVLFGSSRNIIKVTTIRKVDAANIEVVLIDVEDVDTYFAGAANGIVVLSHNKVDDYRDEN